MPWVLGMLLMVQYDVTLRSCGGGGVGAGPNPGLVGGGGSLSASSSTDWSKILALRTAALLLSRVPERESSLLSAVVNNIGDPGRGVAACARHVLRSTFLGGHPAMTAVVAREVQQLAYLPNLLSRALYNCVLLLNQIKLTPAVDRTAATGGAMATRTVGDDGGTPGYRPPSPPLPSRLTSSSLRWQCGWKTQPPTNDQNLTNLNPGRRRPPPERCHRTRRRTR